MLRGDASPPPRNLFWCSGSQAGWWAVRSGDWKLVSQRGRIELFDLSKDPGEQNDLAGQMTAKVADLTRLHDA